MTDPTPETWIERYRRGGEEIAAIVAAQLAGPTTRDQMLAALEELNDADAPTTPHPAEGDTP